MIRYCEKFIQQDLNKKMVFLGGPRQVGKTTLSKQLCRATKIGCQYFNWDVDEDRRIILAKTWLANDGLVIFDELHKYPKWKQWIKGVYDLKPSEQQYLVTGSARLDVYRQGGDSLIGRYHYWRLHPFTLDEHPADISDPEAYRRLLTYGGFPEPFLMNDEREVRRWRRERFDRILREDVRDLENIRNIQLLTLFVDALRNRAGSLIILSNIAQDLEISAKTAKQWLALAERMYICFAIYPLARNLPRSIKKPAKVFFYDNGDTLTGDGPRLENLVATTLLKRLHFLKDYYGYTCSLHYIRDRDRREVDFAVIIEGKLELLIEVKLSDDKISNSLKYYTQKLQPRRAVQIVGNLARSYEQYGILVTNPVDFFVNSGPWDQV